MSITNHPNRSKRNPKPSANPKPEDIIAARDRLGVTQKQAGSVIYAGERSFQDWESGERRMHPAWWELFQLKTDPRAMARVILGLGPDFIDKLMPHLEKSKR